MALIQFSERPYQVIHHDIKIFIQGVDVSPWVTGSIAVTRSNRDGFGTASFMLDNAMDRFTVTEENLQGTWRDTGDRYSEKAKHEIYLYKTGQDKITDTRVEETVSILFERNLQIQEVSPDKPKRRYGNRGDDIDTLNVLLAVQDTAKDLDPSMLEDSASELVAATALSEILMAAGMSPSRAAKESAKAISSVKRKLATAQGKAARERDRKNRGVSKYEVNPDGSTEDAGKYKKTQSRRNPRDTDTGDQRWPLQDRSSIFHKNDPIRIFIANPLTEEDEWFYEFTGFVESYPVSIDYLTGQSTITITCYDIRALIQKMRISGSRVIGGIAEPDVFFLDRSSIFADIFTGGDFGHSYAFKKFEDAMSVLITGTNLERQGNRNRLGVGDFAVGKVVTYPVTDNSDDQINRDTLDAWHTMCLNGPSSISDENSIANREVLTSSEVYTIGRGTTSDGPYTPLRGFVHFLLPKDGTAARQFMQAGWQDYGDSREWTDRFTVITDFCATLDYEYTVLPNGDMAFEFPMYDFLPEDFGEWANGFQYDKHLISSNISDEGGEVTTAVIATGGVEQRETDDIAGGPKNRTPKGIVQCSIMAARVGVTVAQVSKPFVRGNARLRTFALIEFQKKLASANSMDLSGTYRPWLMPNRPFMNTIEKRMGLTSSVTNTLTMFGIGETSMALRFIRQVRADGTFRFITGGDAMPISYRKIFPGNKKSLGNARVGVRTYPELDGDPSAVDDQETTKTSGQSNEDHPPPYIREARPGQYYTLTPETRQAIDLLAQVINDEDHPIKLNNTPKSNSRSFAIQARDEEGRRLYSDKDRLQLAIQAKDLGYVLLDTGGRFRFEPRRQNQPTFIVMPEAQAEKLAGTQDG